MSEETKKFWNGMAEDWKIQVGEEGDANRRLNSDPVLWAFAGEVSGKDVLDAGCGTGYLTKKLRDKGARAIGVDHSERMIETAKESNPDLDYRVDSCSDLATVEDASVDTIVSKYVLMDTPDLEETLAAFHRVLRPGGVAVLIFSHPCFPQGRTTLDKETMTLHYHWKSSYYDRQKCVDPPWNHFTSDFIWFHRPLSDYWKAFRGAGFAVVDFEEPTVQPERYHLAESEEALAIHRLRPCSVAFKIQKAL